MKKPYPRSSEMRALATRDLNKERLDTLVEQMLHNVRVAATDCKLFCAHVYSVPDVDNETETEIFIKAGDIMRSLGYNFAFDYKKTGRNFVALSW